MTRYARAGKGTTHQRVAKDSTPWEELKPPSPQRKRETNDTGNNEKPTNNKRTMQKERFSQSGSSESHLKPNDNDPDQPASKEAKKKGKKSTKPAIRGFGQSKSVKVFGQFWVPVDEAKRLKNLSKKLKSQGLPRKEILEILKNERRKAEKAAKRQRDKTCFQCRQFGHVLSDCPNLKKAYKLDPKRGEEDADVSSMDEQGLVCFKCGSTEHTSRKCKRKGENFEFAKCFICSGTGHIARQCPKNEKGIYPSGGSCSECGSLTHLKKDCPDLVGIETDPSAKDAFEDDAVALPLLDPFASTEYEPMKEFASDKEDDTDAALTPNKQKGVKSSTKKGRNKNKRKNREDNEPFEFDSECFANNNNDSESSKKVLSSNPKKRKIVKF